MEKIARKKVIIVTPNGFLPQEPLDGNPYQKHISGWEISEFIKKGYKCLGMRGIKFLRGVHASLTYRPRIFWGIITVLSQSIVYYFPSLSFELCVIKHIDSKT